MSASWFLPPSFENGSDEVHLSVLRNVVYDGIDDNKQCLIFEKQKRLYETMIQYGLIPDVPVFIKPFVEHAPSGTEESNAYLAYLMLDSEYSEDEQTDTAENVASGLSSSAYGYSDEGYCYADCAAQKTIDRKTLIFIDATNYGSVDFSAKVATRNFGEGNNKLNKLPITKQKTGPPKYFEMGEIVIPPRPEPPKPAVVKTVSKQPTVVDTSLDKAIDPPENNEPNTTEISAKTTATRYHLREGARNKDYSKKDDILEELCDETKDEKFRKTQRGRKSTKTSNITFEKDEYFCEDCNKWYINELCTVHVLKYIQDNKIAMDSENPAQTTVPVCVKLSQSGLKFRGVGFGIWATQEIPKGTVFGPYKGVRVSADTGAADNGYSWEIVKPNGQLEYIDASDIKQSNWMRYVNCPTHKLQMNLVAFQWKGEIYYKVVKDILKYTELFVWYGDEYGKELNIIEETYHAELTVTKKIDAEAVCTKCVPPMGFANFKDFLKHYDFRHNSVPVFKCEFPGCTSAFRRCSDLVRHQIRHTEKYRCSEEGCGVCAATATELKTHLLKHTGEKPFKCSVEGCSEAFSVKGNLQLHIATVHLRTKNFVCGECGRAFGHKCSLKLHQRLHTGAKPFECPHCLGRFYRSLDLKGHLRSKHKQDA